MDMVAELDNVINPNAVSRWFPNGRDRFPAFTLYYLAGDGKEWAMEIDQATFDRLEQEHGKATLQDVGYWTWEQGQ